MGLFRRSASRSAAKSESPAVPAGCRVYAVGDVHGCFAQLEALLGNIESDCAEHDDTTHLVFVGDLVDRGPGSADVIRKLRRGPLPCRHQSFIMGNHEEAMLAVYDGDLESLNGWLTYGGTETLESYGIDRAEIFRLGQNLPQRMRAAIPAEDIAFIRSFEDQVPLGDYLFVHAGIRPGVPLREQDENDLRWIRSEFLDDDETDHGAVIVHGHTISSEPEIRSNRIGIDTGCYSSGRLTALVLEGTSRRFLTN